jgi:hypothetical protein
MRAGGKPGRGNLIHALPSESGFVTAATKHSIPQPRTLGAKSAQCFPVAWNGMVGKVPSDHRPQLCFDLMKFRGQSRPHRGAKNQKRSIPVHTTGVC